jgi:hypothetical protein
MRTDCIKDLIMLFDSKLLFHHHVDYTFPKLLKMLEHISTLTYSFPTLDSLLLYVTLVKSILEYTSPIWNSIATTDANKLKRVQGKFASLCFKRLFSI